MFWSLVGRHVCCLCHLPRGRVGAVAQVAWLTGSRHFYDLPSLSLSLLVGRCRHSVSDAYFNAAATECMSLCLFYVVLLLAAGPVPGRAVRLCVLGWGGRR